LFDVEEREEAVAEANSKYQAVSDRPTELNRSVSEFDRKKHETRYLCEQSC
jgi:hypothetical protein